MKKYFLFLIFVLYSVCGLSENFNTTTSYKVCFTPNQNCTNIIIDMLNQANSEVLVQAYSFTSAPIAKALVNAMQRGVDVKVILDKTQYKENGYSSAKFFMNNHIPVWIDYKPNIAHNKIMVIDNKTVITGSFNFTRAAQERNAENVLLINDVELAKTYRNNWMNRLQESKKPGPTSKKIKHHHPKKQKEDEFFSENTINKFISYGKRILKSFNLD